MEAAIVLCGGRSRRMGRDKASLPFGDETLLSRTVRIVGSVVSEVMLVAREGQDLPAGLQAVRDPAEGLGPLAGIAAGLAAMGAERAFVTSCDAPLLCPAVVRRLLDLSAGFEAAVPFIDGYHMTTAAVYAKSIAPVAARLVGEGRLRPLYLMQAVRAREVTATDLRDIDPDLESFMNCNTPEEYAAAVRRAGLA